MATLGTISMYLLIEHKSHPTQFRHVVGVQSTSPFTYLNPIRFQANLSTVLFSLSQGRNYNLL